MLNHLSRSLLLIVVAVAISGCKIAVMVTTGGDVQSLSGINNCAGGNVCEINITSNDFDDTFTAVPREGYEFVKWQEGDGFKCGGSTSPTCRINNTALDINPVIADLIAQDSFDYLVPIFRFVGIDTDGDGVKNYADQDDDNDGVLDADDPCPLDPNPGCGINEVSGILGSDTVWRKDDGPVHIVGTLQVPPDVRLTILDGVEVLGDYDIEAPLEVFGELIVQGSSASPVTIRDVQITPRVLSPALATAVIEIQHAELINTQLTNADWGAPLEHILIKHSIIRGYDGIYIARPSADSYIEFNTFLPAPEAGLTLYEITIASMSWQTSPSVYIRNNQFAGGVRINANSDFGQTYVNLNSFSAALEQGSEIIQLSGSVDLDATMNYWRTTDVSLIEAMILDAEDDIARPARASYLPILTTPHPDTPAMP